MAGVGLVVAIVFAAVFGAALLWLAVYYAHRYIHRQCLQLEHWFHILTPYHASWNTCDHEKHAKSRGKSEHKKARRGYEMPAEDEWPEHLRMERTRPVMQIVAPAHNQVYRQQYYPQLDWQHPTSGGGHLGFQQPTMYPQMPQQAAQMSSFAPPQAVPVPQHPFPQPPAAVPEPNHYRRQHQRAYAETASDVPKASRSERSTARPTHPTSPKRARQVNEVDYIHICDEYPPIVLEALKKAAPTASPSSTSSSSSNASTATQEVPRASIPRATLRFANTPAFQVPQYPQRVW